jgi:hypothetical protein
MGESKLQVKIGRVEFSGEGDKEWLTQQLDKILSRVDSTSKGNDSDGSGNDADAHDGGDGSLSLSMTTIAAKLNCTSGPDLVTAAAAFLKFVKKKNTFSRKDIADTQKDAVGYYKANYLSNLTATLVGLVKGDVLTQTSDNAYSLQVKKENELKGLLNR